MKPLILAMASILAAAAIAVSQQTPPSQGQTVTAAEKKETISGTVVRADTRSVLPGVRLELVDVDHERLSTGHEKPCRPEPKSDVSVARHFATTDGTGKFTFTDIVPGGYYLYAENEGFLKFAYGQRGQFPIPTVLGLGVVPSSDESFSSPVPQPVPGPPLRGSGGQLAPVTVRTPAVPGGRTISVNYTGPANVKNPFQNLEISLTPAPSIAGMVVDEKGISLAAASVQLYQYRYTPLNGRTLKSVRAALTNDEGKFRLFWLDPARYLVAAGYSEFGQRPWTTGITFTPNLPGADSGLPMMFYPASPAATNAVYVPLNPGAQPIVDFRLRSRLRLTARVRLTGDSIPTNAALVVVPSGGDLCAAADYGIATQRDGTFEVRDIPEGLYVAAAMSGRDFVSDVVTMKVENGAPNQLSIPVTAPTTIQGNIYFEGVPKDLDLSGVRINLTRKGQELRTVANAVPDPMTGRFSLSGLGPGTYYPTVDLPPGMYVENIAAAKFDPNDREKCLEDVSSGSPNYSYMDSHGHLDPARPIVVPVTIPAAAECLTIKVRAGNPFFGYVYDSASRTLPGALVVALPKGVWSKSDDGGVVPPDRILTTTTDSTGRFHLLGTTESLYPGSIVKQEYKLYAFESIDPNEIFNPSLVDRFQNREIFRLVISAFENGHWSTISEAPFTVALSNMCDVSNVMVSKLCVLSAIPAADTVDIR